MDEKKQDTELAHAVAAFLPEWTARKDQYERAYLGRAEDDARVWLGTITYGHNRGRVEIRGHYPPPFLGNNYHPSGAPSITVSAERGPEKIAREITRRFLPDYLPVYTELAQRRRADESNAAAAGTLAADLAAVFGKEPPRSEPYDSRPFHFYAECAGYGYVSVSVSRFGNSTKLELTAQTPAAALSLARFLAGGNIASDDANA